MKKSITILICVVLLLAILFTLGACNKNGNSDYAGTYYSYKNGEKQSDDWIKLEKDKWSDNEGASGRLEEKDGVLYGYVVFFGEEDVIFWGTAENGVLDYTLGEKFPASQGIYYRYYADNSTAEKKSRQYIKYDDDSNGTNSSSNNNNSNGNSNSTNGNSNSTNGQSTNVQYSVTFNCNGGFLSGERQKVVKVNENEKITEPSSPTKTEYVFAGWAKDENGENMWNFSTDTVTKDTVLYAVWTKELIERQVKFVLNYSEAQDETQSTENGLVTYSPKRTGYEFNGWYIDAALNTKWNMGTKVTVDDLILYADWVEEITEEGQLKAPSLSVKNQTNFYWEPIKNANGYRIVVVKKQSILGDETIIDETINGTNWTFPSYKLPAEAGIYNYSIKICAKGDGINTINSAYATRSWQYKLRVLDNLTGLTFDKKTSILSWDPVENVEEYEIVNSEFGSKTTLSKQTEPSFDMSGMDAGNYNIIVYAERTNWQGSYQSITVNKVKLKTVTVEIDYNVNTDVYSLSWNSVRYATHYILTFGEKQIRQTERSYAIPNDSMLWSYGNKIDFTVQAFDENADYLISLSDEYSINKRYKVFTEKNIDNAGITVVNVSKEEMTLSFDMNGKKVSGIEEQTITKDKGMVYPPVPRHADYIFTGWYTTKDCDELFDFSKGISDDTKVYAGWRETSSYIIVSSEINEFSAAVVDSTFKYFAILNSGTYTIRYKNSNSNSAYAVNMVLYDVTEDMQVKSFSCNYTNYSSIEFQGVAGHTYRLVFTKQGYSSTVYYSVYGNNTPKDGGKIGGENNFISVSANANITITASTNNGYTWLGWYDGETKVSEGTSLTYTFTMSAENKTYTAKWITCPITLEKNIPEAGVVSGVEGKTVVDEETTINAITNNGYTWLGWYDGETKVSEGTSLTYTFTMSAENKTYTAKWMICPIILEKNILEAGVVSGVEQTIVGAETTITAITNGGYTWLGWYDGETKVSEGTSLSYTFNMPAENKTYTAKWYKIGIEKNISAAGTVSSPTGKYIVGDEVTVTATTNNGYTWLGWYDGETKVSEGTSLSYTFTMPAESKTYTAKWMICPIILEKNILEAGLVRGVEQTIVGAETTITAITNDGYTWLGWYDGETKVSEGTSLSYTFTMPAENKTYTAKWITCPIILEKNILEAGLVRGVEQTIVGAETTITAITNDGYTWLGWYDGETKVSEDTSLSYTFTMGTEDKIYTAKWSHYSVSYDLAGGVNGENPTYFETYASVITLNDPKKVTSETNSSEYLGNGNYRVTKETTAYTFLGWYTESTFDNEVTEITYTGSDIVLYAKWSETTSTTTTTTESAYLREGNYVYFGTYPQTQVTDSAIKSALTSMAGTLPTSSNSQNWTSYGYYINGSVSNFMWYIDLTYNGEKYRGVYFTSYRPLNTASGSFTSSSRQDDNGYDTSTVYWFKYDPIKWRILSETNGEALILAEMIIDGQQYDTSSNNYESSDIRNWLNETFYNTAFNDLQKAIIQLTTVDNSARSRDPNNTQWNSGYNSYACENTQDKVFLLSVQEVTNSAYGFNADYWDSDAVRRKKPTAYARCQGASGSSGNGWWWLRSPHGVINNALGVNSDGNAYTPSGPVYNTFNGVVPALRIKL